MSPDRLSLKSRFSVPYAVCLTGGFVIGFELADTVFPKFEATFGDPLTHTFLGICGALFAALAYELVTTFRRPRCLLLGVDFQTDPIPPCLSLSDRLWELNDFGLAALIG
jgi:hypothetical protein